MKNKSNKLTIIVVIATICFFTWQTFMHKQYQDAITNATSIGADETVVVYQKPKLLILPADIDKINNEAILEVQEKINNACVAANLSTDECQNLIETNNLDNANEIIAFINDYALNSNLPTIEEINDQSSIFYYVNKDDDNILDSNYEPDLVKLPDQYTYNTEIYVDQRIYNDLVNMLEAANTAGIKIVVGSGYRSYSQQVSTYQNWVNQYGEVEANKVSAQPGHSEHQTGLAIDIMQTDYDSACYLETCFENSPAFQWMNDNAYKYGFIIRYPKNKEELTGYSYEPWHYRYVGVDFATYLHDNNLTFDEYVTKLD